MSRVVLSRELLAEKAKVKVVDIELPELGEGVVVPIIPMTAKEWTEFQSEQVGKNGKPNAKAKTVRERLVIHCCRDDNGTPVFTDADMDMLSQCKAGIIERIVDSILQNSGLVNADVEAIAKNSDETPEG